MGDDTTQQCAANVMDTFHAIMRAIKPEARKGHSTDLSVQQFRALMTIDRHQGASLSLVSEHLGATLSAASKLIDGLVERGYVRRDSSTEDRRRLTLAVTDQGTEVLESVHREVVGCLAEKLATLTEGERSMVNLAMDLLRSALMSTQPGPTAVQLQK